VRGFAIWDAIGKALGQPSGGCGRYRDRVPVNIIGGYYGRDLGGIRDEVAEWRARGFRAPSSRSAASSRAGRRAYSRRPEAAGDDFVLTIDANQGTRSSRRSISSPRLGPRHPLVRGALHLSNDRRDMREVRTRGGIPVCAGQSEYALGLPRPL